MWKLILEMANSGFYLTGVCGVVLCSIGILVNSFAIRTLLVHKLTAIFHKLMLALVCYDLIYVVLYMLCYSLPKLSVYYDGKKIFL